MNWQPIETAPTDGESFMLWISKDSVVGPHCFAPVSHLADGSWWDDATGDRIELIRAATHWTPLPPPPGEGA